MNTQEIQGHWDTIRGKVKERWGHLTDDDLKIIGGNVDQVIGRIQAKTGENREAIENFFNESMPVSGMARARETVTRARETATQYAQSATQYAQDVGERAREGYQQVREQAREGYQQVREQAREGYDRAEHMVQRRPAESMAVVFAAGLLTGVLVGVMLHMDDRR